MSTKTTSAAAAQIMANAQHHRLEMYAAINRRRDEATDRAEAFKYALRTYAHYQDGDMTQAEFEEVVGYGTNATGTFGQVFTETMKALNTLTRDALQA